MDASLVLSTVADSFTFTDYYSDSQLKSLTLLCKSMRRCLQEWMNLRYGIHIDSVPHGAAFNTIMYPTAKCASVNRPHADLDFSQTEEAEYWNLHNDADVSHNEFHEEFEIHSELDDGFGPGNFDCGEVDSNLDVASESNCMINDAINDEVPAIDYAQEVDAQIALAIHTLERKRVMGLLPWETSAMKRVFQPASFDWPVAKLPIMGGTFFSETSQSSNSRPSTYAEFKPGLSFALRRIRAVKMVQSPDVLRQRALVKWRLILERDLDSSLLGKSLKVHAETLVGDAIIAQSINDAFSNKATATLFKRASSIMTYLQWADLHNIPLPMRFNEELLYQYVCHLRQVKSKPTVASAFIESVSFCTHVLGMPSPSEYLSSRVKGVSHAMYVTKQRLSQAPPLTVEQVQALERAVIESDNDEEVIIGGHLLFCLYASCRFSDSIYIENIRSSKTVSSSGEDIIIIETETTEHKTAVTKERSTTLLPLLALGVGLVGDWSTCWLSARERAGLSASHRPSLPAPLSNGKWSSRRITTGEATTVLRELLISQGIEPEVAASISSHSLKATVLSWMAKDSAPMELRRITGHHMDGTNKSALTYSRDAMISAHVYIYRILWKIRSFRFDPDATRVQMIAQESDRLESEVIDVDQTVEDEPDDEVDSIVDASEEASYMWEVLTPDVKLPAFNHDQSESFVQHCVYGTIHLSKEDGTLACGRAKSDRYNTIVQFDPVEWPICQQCRPQC